MPIIKLNKHDIKYIENNHSQLTYNHKKNVIEGILSFDLKYEFTDKGAIKDQYQILIDLNQVSDLGIPIVKETKGRILKIAERKKLFFGDLHLNNTEGEMCMILPPKIKEKYPTGFDLKILLEHTQEHLYWVSYYERYNEKPWKEYGHEELGYLELYFEDKKLYSEQVKKYFGCESRAEFRRKIQDLKKRYKYE